MRYQADRAMCDAGVFAIWCVVTVNVNQRPLNPPKQTLFERVGLSPFVPKTDIGRRLSGRVAEETPAPATANKEAL
jgi:hypothetical protein